MRFFFFISPLTNHSERSRMFLNSMGEITMNKDETLRAIGEIATRSPMTIFRWNAGEDNWPVELVSDNVFRLTGYTPREFYDGSIIYSELIYFEDITRVRQEVSYYSQQSDCATFKHAPYRITHKAGYQVWVEDYTNIIRDTSGKIQFYEGIVYNCSSRIAAEKALIEKEEYIREFESLSGTASGEFVSGVNHLYSSPNLSHLMNTQENDLNQDLQSIEFAVHEDDIAKVHNTHVNFLKAPVPYTLVYRIKAHDGEIRYIKESVRLEIDDMREARSLFLFSDITEEYQHRNI